jgi:hypothetical protein
MTINFDTITNNYEVIYVIKTVMKYHLKKIDTSFHQPLPNMVQRLFTNRGSKRGTILTVIRQKVKYNKYNTDPEHNMSKFFNYIIHLYSTYYEFFTKR